MWPSAALSRAASLATIALYLRDNRLAKHVFGLDSFQGFDESVEKDIALGGAADAEKRVGGFEATSLARVRAKLARLGPRRRGNADSGLLCRNP
jgi:hypothetical protein